MNTSTSSLFDNRNNLSTQVEATPQQLDTGFDALAKYVKQYRPAQTQAKALAPPVRHDEEGEAGLRALEREARAKQLRDQMAGPAPVTRWMKYIQGIGPVEVAEGTDGAYSAGNIRPAQTAYEQSVGLRPGLVGASHNFSPHADNSAMDDKAKQEEKDKKAAAPAGQGQQTSFQAWGHTDK